MRKLRGGASVGGMGSSGTGGLDDCAGGANPQHTALGLMHLKKLFSEYTHPPHPLSDVERDDKLYNMLPLFCKVTLYLYLCGNELPLNMSHDISRSNTDYLIQSI